MATIPKMARRCRELLRHKNNKKQQKWERKVKLMYECAEEKPRGERSTKWRRRMTARMDELMERGVKLLLAAEDKLEEKLCAGKQG